jgi:GTP cyclohydrolase IA
MMDDLSTIYSEIIKQIGENPERDGLRETPVRAANAMKFLTQGYSIDLDSLVNNAIYTSENDDMVICKDIEIYSLCEHHMLPFFGKCHIGYIPNGKVMGVSKLARIADAFARRLQIQENLTRQIAVTIEHYTNAKGVAVVIEAHHLCMMMRGVEKQNSSMKTSVMLGGFRHKASTRAEFFKLIEGSR